MSEIVHDNPIMIILVPIIPVIPIHKDILTIHHANFFFVIINKIPGIKNIKKIKNAIMPSRKRATSPPPIVLLEDLMKIKATILPMIPPITTIHHATIFVFIGSFWFCINNKIRLF